MKTDLSKSGRVTEAGAFHRLADHYARGARAPFEHVVLDDAQDVTVGKLRFFVAIGGAKADGLFFAGDQGVRVHDASRQGLEFRAVAVMACDDQIIPSQSRIGAITDEADLEEVYATERHLLYVAVTRARDHLLVSAAVHGSEFLDDMIG